MGRSCQQGKLLKFTIFAIFLRLELLCALTFRRQPVLFKNLYNEPIVITNFEM